MRRCYVILIILMLLSQYFMVRNMLYFEISTKALYSAKSSESIVQTIPNALTKENKPIERRELNKEKKEGNGVKNIIITSLLQQNNKNIIDAKLRIYPEEITDNLPSKFVKRLKYTYPPFVLPPPVNEEPEFVESKFYKGSLNNKKKCNLEICKDLTNHLYQYLPNSCNILKCNNDKLYRVIYEKKNLIGYVDIIKDATILNGFSCGINCNSLSIPNNKDNNNIQPHVKGKLVYLVTPEGYSFQHFLDSVMPKIVQIEDFIKDEEVKFYIGLQRSKFPIVEKLYNRIGINSSRLIGTDHVSVYSEVSIIPCYCPTMHPYLWQRIQYLFKLPYLFEENGNNNKNVNMIVYISRNSNSFNKGRKVINEKELLELIRKLLSNTKYNLVIYNSKEFEHDVDKMINYWNNVKVLIGSHGGGLYNMFFMRKGSTIIEFLPKSNAFYKKLIHLIIYSHSVMLGNYYYNLMCESFSHFNMQVDLEKFEKLFTGILNNLI